MRAGELRIPFRLEKPAETIVAGKATPKYVDQGLAWGSFEGLTGTDRGGITANAEYRIRLRYRTDITPFWRLRWGTRVFGIISVVDPAGRRQELVVFASEVL